MENVKSIYEVILPSEHGGTISHFIEFDQETFIQESALDGSFHIEKIVDCKREILAKFANNQTVIKIK